LRGKIDECDKENYKLDFHVNKRVGTGRYVNETKKKEYDTVRVNGTVQMWTLEGQTKALEDRAKAIEATSGLQNLPDKKKEALHEKNISEIKSIAIFRSEGSSEAKYLFPTIFSGILIRLPAEIIWKDQYNDDLKLEEVSPTL